MNDYINLFEQTIDEAYIGKSETLKEIDKLFQTIHDNVKRGQDITSKKEVQQLNRLVEKQFGMDIYSLRITQEEAINAYTCTIGTKFDIALEYDMRSLVKGTQSEGYRFVPNNNLCVVTTISLGLLRHPNITGEQLTAVILHEIGHNFACCLDNTLKISNRRLIKNYYNYCILKASIIFGRKYRKELKTNTNKYERKESEKQEKKHIFRGWIKGLSAIKYNFTSFCKEVKRKLAARKYDPKRLTDVEQNSEEEKIKNELRRKDEVFADKFAAIYGYGTELITSLYTMDTNQTKAAKFLDKVFGKEVNDNYEKLCQYYFLFDEHPHIIQRANSAINTLKAELTKEDLDPKVREVIQKQIAEMERIVREITTASKNDTERQAVRKAFYKAVNEKSPDALSKELEDEIEKELDDAIEKNK